MVKMANLKQISLFSKLHMTFFVFFLRATGSSAPRPTAISATGRSVTSTTTSIAVTRTSRPAAQQPVKPLVTASAARKGGAPFIKL